MNKHCRSLVSVLNRAFPQGPRLGAEIGVWRGHTTVSLLKRWPHLRMYAVDPWERIPCSDTMIKTVQEVLAAKNEFLDLITPHLNRVEILAMTSQEAAPRVPSEILDFVFIDDDHTYEQVKLDLCCWWSRVTPGGIVCGHDYNGVGDRTGRFGVKRAVDEWAAGRGPVGVEPGLIWWMRKEV